MVGNYYLEKHTEGLYDELPNRVDIMDDTLGGTAIFSYEAPNANSLQRENINVISVDENEDDIIEFKQVKNDGLDIKTDTTYVNTAGRRKSFKTLGDTGFIKPVDNDSTVYNRVNFNNPVVKSEALREIKQEILDQREAIEKYELRNKRRTKSKATK